MAVTRLVLPALKSVLSSVLTVMIAARVVVTQAITAVTAKRGANFYIGATGMKKCFSYRFRQEEELPVSALQGKTLFLKQRDQINPRRPASVPSIRQSLRPVPQFVQKRLNERRRFARPESGQGHGCECIQRNGPDFWGQPVSGNGERQSDAKPAFDVSLDQRERSHFDAGKPVDAQPAQALLKMFRDRFIRRQADEGFFDFVPLPKFLSRRQATGSLHEQDQRQLQQRERVDARGWFAFEERHREVKLLLLQPGFQLRLVSLAQGQFQVGKFFAHVLRQFRQVVAQDGARGAKPDLLCPAPAQFVGQRFQPVKERLDETKELFAAGGQRKRAAIEQRQSQRFFQLDDLRADRRLLNAVRDVARRLADAAMPGNIIEQLQVMDIHGSKGFAGECSSWLNRKQEQRERGSALICFRGAPLPRHTAAPQHRRHQTQGHYRQRGSDSGRVRHQPRSHGVAGEGQTKPETMGQ